MGERLTWCRKARPQPSSVGGRTVAAAAQKAVLWCLVDHSNADGTSYPKQDTIAEEACLSRQSVNAAISALEAQGFLTVAIDPEARRSRIYWLDLSHIATDAGSEPVAGGDTSSDLQASVDRPSPQEHLSQEATRRQVGRVASCDTDLSQEATPYKKPLLNPALASASAEGKSAPKTTNQILASILLDESSTAQHFLRRLVEVDERWAEITPGVLIKLGRTYGAPTLVEALGYMREEGRGGIDPYPYLESVCVRIDGEHQAVSA
jgi:hypothetical protein